LTYQSAQEHDGRVDKLLENPFAVIAAMNSKDHRKVFLGLAALAKGWKL
jgi:hypothetical protein